MLYHAYELTHAAITPFRTAAKLGVKSLRDPMNPFSSTYGARSTAAAFEMFVLATRRYGKPEFGIDSVEVDGVETPIVEETPLVLPFGDLLHFRRDSIAADKRSDQPVLIVAPMSGHFATLLRGTVKAMLPEHDVYITDWTDARDIPMSEGRFDLSDYIDYIQQYCAFLYKRHGERPAVLAVCQPGVPVMASTALMAEDNAPERPASVTLMGSPIDVSKNPTEPNVLATDRPLSWFEKNVISTVPFPNAGVMRPVYPGFLQLSGFMSMNMDRHVDAHVNHYNDLIKGDGDSAAAHREFYDEYLAVMDLTAEYYLETIDVVFQRMCLPKGEMMYRGNRLVRPDAIKDVALMTVEGEKDDITGIGQTRAAHALCTNLPDSMKLHFEQEKVGHYGVFNGSRWRESIQPRVAAFFAENRDGVEVKPKAKPVKAKPAKAVAEKKAAPAKVAAKPIAKPAAAKAVKAKAAKTAKPAAKAKPVAEAKPMETKAAAVKATPAKTVSEKPTAKPTVVKAAPKKPAAKAATKPVAPKTAPKPAAEASAPVAETPKAKSVEAKAAPITPKSDVVH
ncbi:MAG: polyhydroxyalkanoate depolymerase [Pikeienuella sp.]